MTSADSTDAGGAILKLHDIDGNLFATLFKPEVVRGLKNLPFREDDVIISSYPKTGCHWSWEITRMVLAGRVDVDILEKMESMLELFPAEVVGKLPSPRVLNTHVYLKNLNPELLTKKVKIILVLRNPKDVAVSFYNHHTHLPEYNYNGEFKNYLPLFLSGKVDYNGFCEFHLDWERELQNHPDHPVHIMYYEDMKEDLAREVKRLGKFLGKEYDDKLYEEIAEKCTFDNMKGRKKHVYEQHGLGDDTIYRKGEVGDWKTWFTVAQSEQLDKMFNGMLKETRFRFRYDLRQSKATKSDYTCTS